MVRHREFFERFEGAYQALWWVRSGTVPTINNALARLWHIDEGNGVQRTELHRTGQAAKEQDHADDPHRCRRRQQRAGRQRVNIEQAVPQQCPSEAEPAQDEGGAAGKAVAGDGDVAAGIQLNTDAHIDEAVVAENRFLPDRKYGDYTMAINQWD